jgi:general secretion pathway protein B
VPTLAELPDGIRQQVPPLTLGGGVYSTQAAQRLVIVNGQVVHEGDQPAAGLRVVQIRPRSVVFSFQGQAFEIGL